MHPSHGRCAVRQFPWGRRQEAVLGLPNSSGSVLETLRSTTNLLGRQPNTRVMNKGRKWTYVTSNLMVSEVTHFLCLEITCCDSDAGIVAGLTTGTHNHSTHI